MSLATAIACAQLYHHRRIGRAGVDQNVQDALVLCSRSRGRIVGRGSGWRRSLCRTHRLFDAADGDCLVNADRVLMRRIEG